MLRNRQRLLTSARRSFHELGLDVSIEEIARRAGVGATTFYRHFPTRDALIEALLDDLVQGAREAANQAAAQGDPWTAFRTILVNGCALTPDDLALFDTIAALGPQFAERTRALTAEVIGDIVRRAQQAGVLRQDVTVDIVASFMRVAGHTTSPADRAVINDVLLNGLRSTASATAFTAGEPEPPA